MLRRETSLCCDGDGDLRKEDVLFYGKTEPPGPGMEGLVGPETSRSVLEERQR